MICRSRVIVCLLAVLAMPGFALAEESNHVDFNRDIRPILATSCFTCHGPDEEHREAELRLDIRDGIFAETSSGLANVVAGDPEKSELFLRVTHEDVDVKMPPEDYAKQLTTEQIELLRRWIKEGAEWEEHWAFVTPQSPELPTAKRKGWARGPIDQFVLARLERDGLSPNAEADRRTLIRRVTLDLTGVVPTPAEVNSFVEDTSSDAYEKVVDRLLASPRYGERMAVEWLDAARYADTHGYHEDYHRDMWPWRDWVIKALNANMPFDQFTREQIAGDLLPNATQDQRIATGFNRNHGVTASGISEEYRVEYAIDRTVTTSTVFLGLTMGCAKCHDHKYDPISQKEFYQLYAYFNSITNRGIENRSGNVDPLIKVITLERVAETAEYDAKIAEFTKRMEAYGQGVDAQVAAWEQGLGDGLKAWPDVTDGLIVHVPFDETEGKEPASLVGDFKGKIRSVRGGSTSWTAGKKGGALRFEGNAWVELGDNGTFDRLTAFSWGAWVNSKQEGIVVARTALPPDLRGYEFRVGGGKIDVRLTSFEPEDGLRVITEVDAPLNEWSHVFVTYDGSSRGAGVKIYLNGEPQKTTVTRDSLYGTIRTERPLQVGRRANLQAMEGMVDDVRVYDRELTAMEVARLADRDLVSEILTLASAERSDEQKETLRQHYLQFEDEAYAKLRAEMAALRSHHRVLSTDLPTVMVMKEMEKPLDTFVLLRGHYETYGEQVQHGTPSVMPGLPEGAPPNRLGLAAWLTDPSHPLVSRVTVNRFWQMFFGSGLVATSEDFGIQGERPSHPELLDYLATEFVAGGWDVKSILREIALSSTYKQSSRVSRNQYQSDPGNRLLARGPRYRLPAEMIRDNALAVSGLLVEKIGGPSVKPYQPEGLWAEISNRSYRQDSGEALFRRSLYTYLKRAAPQPNMAAMDAPNREICTVRRQRTSTPLMALVLMNDPTYVEAARGLAQRMMLETGSTAKDRIRFAYETVLSRSPNTIEASELTLLFEQRLQVYQQDDKAAAMLLSVGESPRDEELDAAEHAAWTCVASVLLNLDETISKE